MMWSRHYNSGPQNSKQHWQIIFHILTVDAKKPNKLVNDVLYIFLYIINPKKYCTFQLCALCVRARTMHGLEMHLMFCYNEFWIYLRICSLFKSILLPFLSNLYCTSIKRPTSIKVTPNLRGATFTEINFFDHIKANYLNLHFPKKLT